MKRVIGALAAAVVACGGAQAQVVPETKLTASDGVAVDLFGASVAVSGGTVLVGAPWDDGNGTDGGSVYLFDADGTETKRTASDGAAGDRFGTSVAISGDTALVGANEGDDKGSASGAAYLFDVDRTETKLAASNGTSDDLFGYAVALSGSLALVGAPPVSTT